MGIKLSRFMCSQTQSLAPLVKLVPKRISTGLFGINEPDKLDSVAF